MAKIQLNGKKVVIKSNYSILDLLKKYKLSNKKVKNDKYLLKCSMVFKWLML